MNFRTNFSKITLLFNEKIKIYLDDKVIEFIPPKIKMYLTDIDFMEFLGMLKYTPETFNKVTQNSAFVVKNNYETFLAILRLQVKTEQFVQYFCSLFPNLTYKESQFFCGGIPLSADEFDLLLEFIFVSVAEKDFEEFMVKVETGTKRKLSELEKKRLEQEEKIKRIKKNKEKNKEAKQNSITMDQIVIGIMYEFPSLSLENIYNMDMITFLSFWANVGKVVDTQIQVAAAGNGLTKEFTYFIN